MALTCADLEKLVQPYLDGELSDDDRATLEQHTIACASCNALMQHEIALRGAIRAKLAPPRAPAALRPRVLAALDDEDRRAITTAAPGPLWPRLLATAATAAAAAAIALFFLAPNAERGGAGGAAVEALAPRGHEARIASTQPAMSRNTLSQRNPFIAEHQMRPIPVALSDDAQIDRLERELSRRVGVRVRVPTLHGVQRSAMTARYTRLPGHDTRAAQFSYVLVNDRDGRRYDLSVTVFDPTGVEIPAKRRVRIGDTDVLCDSDHGYHSVFFLRDGVGYAMSSGSMGEDQLIELARSNIHR